MKIISGNSSESTQSIRIAVADIGGTCIKSGIWEKDEIHEIRETPTQAHLGGTHVMERVVEILEGYHGFQAIGISSAGQVNTEKGSILYANDNIPGYTGTNIREILEKRFGVPVSVGNDVNCAAAGEAFYGAGREHDSFLCLTYGTGVGGAIVLGGEVYTGASYSAGEFGGIIVHPEDRDTARDMFSGCYERYASTTALVERVKARYPELGNGREIFARLDDCGVCGLIDQWIGEVILGLISLTHIFNPSLIILGGGIMGQGYVIQEVGRRLQEQLIPSFRKVEIRPAELGNQAGLLGAAKAAEKIWLERKESQNE